MLILFISSPGSWAAPWERTANRDKSTAIRINKITSIQTINSLQEHYYTAITPWNDSVSETISLLSEMPFLGMEKIWQWLTDRKAYCSLLDSFWMRSASLLLKLNGTMWLLPGVACVSLQPGKVVEMTGKHGAVITWHNNTTQYSATHTAHWALSSTNHSQPFSFPFPPKLPPLLGGKAAPDDLNSF